MVVGVNAFQVEEQVELERLRVDPAIELAQHAEPGSFPPVPGPARVQRTAHPPGEAARGTDNLVPLFITCVEDGVTLGEICNVLRALWGEYQPPAWV